MPRGASDGVVPPAERCEVYVKRAWQQCERRAKREEGERRARREEGVNLYPAMVVEPRRDLRPVVACVWRRWLNHRCEIVRSVHGYRRLSFHKLNHTADDWSPPWQQIAVDVLGLLEVKPPGVSGDVRSDSLAEWMAAIYSPRRLVAGRQSSETAGHNRPPAGDYVGGSAGLLDIRARHRRSCRWFNLRRRT